METDPFSVAMLGALVYTFINFLRNAVNFRNAESKNACVTQLVVWAGGVAAVFLASFADVANGVEVFGQTLESMDVASRILAGFTLGGLASIGNDLLGALDQHRTTENPPLLK